MAEGTGRGALARERHGAGSLGFGVREKLRRRARLVGATTVLQQAELPRTH
jgi:hypothetical protein